MSFILDALKKSETERQEQSSAEFSSVPTSSGNPSPTRWLWLLAALLLVNVAVLLFVLLRPAATPAPLPASEPIAATATTNSFADQVATAVREMPAASSAVEPPPLPATETMPVATAPAAMSPTGTPRASSGYVPTLDQLRLNGAINVPDLRLDIHVFSDDPAARFVFINMDKQREGSRIAAGPVVKEITPDGVILEYQGQDFLLPRE